MGRIKKDIVIIGAGPVGLFQVFELGLQGLSAAVIDSLSEVGGQCCELYPDKPIYDIPAVPNASARTIVENLKVQCAPFKPLYCLSQKVTHITKLAAHKFEVRTDNSLIFECKAVVIAAGNGAFEPIRLKVKGIEKFNGGQLHYKVLDITKFVDKNIVILGGGDNAFDCALALQPVAKNLLLIHRSENFRATPEAVSKMQGLREQFKMQFLAGQTIGFSEEDGVLTHIKVRSGAISRNIELDELLVCFGLSPKLGPINDWGLDMHGHQICVDTEKFQTSTLGIFAVGDVNTYAGKRKLILSGFHEAALAAYAIKQSLSDTLRINTQYTTNSSVLHARLGV